MRDFGKLHSSFWSSPTIRSLTDDGRYLAVYLLTSPHTPASGVFRLPDAYACEDLGWVSKRFRNGFETLSKVQFAERCEKTSWVWICKFHIWNKPENPNVRKSIEKSLQSVPVGVSFRERMLNFWADPRKGFETVSKPQSPSPSPSLLLEEESNFEKLPCDDGSYFDIPQALVAELTQAYPRVNLTSEFAKMRMWLLANAANRKTRRGMPKFINGWLARAPEAVPAAMNGAQLGAQTRQRRELGA